RDSPRPPRVKGAQLETLTPPPGSEDAGDGAAGPSSSPPSTPGGEPRAGRSEPGGVWFGAVLAVVALVFAAVALVMGDGGSSGDPSADGGAGSATIELSEFALTPASVSVAAGGSLEVTNVGAVVHNLSIDGTDVATTDLAGGDSETLDL